MSIQLDDDEKKFMKSQINILQGALKEGEIEFTEDMTDEQKQKEIYLYMLQKSHDRIVEEFSSSYLEPSRTFEKRANVSF